MFPDTSGLYNDYFLYDPTTQQVTNLTNGSAGASPGNGGICPSMALSSDGQDLIYTDYNPNGTVRSGAFTRSGRSDPELGTASGATNIEQLTIAPASTVTFNGNGGTGFMANETANAPTALTANTYTDVGHGFSGWNTAADGSGTAYANGDLAFNTSATLYAQWVQQVAQTITFGTVSSKTMIQSPVTVSATSSSGLPVSFKTTTTTVCTAGGTDGATITLLKPVLQVQATQAGSASYNRPRRSTGASRCRKQPKQSPLARRQQDLGTVTSDCERYLLLRFGGDLHDNHAHGLHSRRNSRGRPQAAQTRHVHRARYPSWQRFLQTSQGGQPELHGVKVLTAAAVLPEPRAK